MGGINCNVVDPSDEEAIRGVLTAYVDFWNSHEMAGLAELFTKDAEWINIVGMHWRGREAIIKAHDVYHRTMFQKVTLAVESIELRAVAENVVVAAMVVRAGAFTPPDGVPRPSTRDRLSLVLAKRVAGWRIVLGHNTVIDERAAPFDPVNSGWTG